MSVTTDNSLACLASAKGKEKGGGRKRGTGEVSEGRKFCLKNIIGSHCQGSKIT